MQRPAYLANFNAPKVAEQAASGLGGNPHPYVSIKQNRFRLVDSAGNEKLIDSFHLDVVIVDVNANVSRIYYADAYDPTATEFKAPTCFSDNGVGPSVNASAPQAATCAVCPHAEWGSATSKVTNKPTKACNDAKKVAVIIPGDVNQMVYALRIPPASLKILKAYAQTVAGHGADLPEIITRLSFDPQTQGVLNFAPTGWIDEPTAGLIQKLAADKATDAVVGRTDTPRLAGPNASPPAALPPAAPPQQAAPAALPPQAPQGMFGVAPASQAAPAAPETAARGRGRPRGQAAPVTPPPIPPAPMADADDIPDFLKRGGEAGTKPAPTFGMAPAAPPTSDIEAQLAAAFSLPLE